MAYLGDLIDRKAAVPEDDILSRLVAEQLQPGHIDRQTMVNITRLLLSAGHQTTQNMIALGVLTLLRHPDQLAAIRRDPGLIRGAVEELLRYSSILHTGARRVALEDIDVNGHLVREGEGVICAIPSANRDEQLFPDPDRFDIEREAGPAHRLRLWDPPVPRSGAGPCGAADRPAHPVRPPAGSTAGDRRRPAAIPPRDVRVRRARAAADLVNRPQELPGAVMHVSINESRCIAAGQCVLNAPEVFDQREDDGIVEILNENPEAGAYASVRLAVRLCPADVITLEED
jgi:ferredoxin